MRECPHCIVDIPNEEELSCQFCGAVLVSDGAALSSFGGAEKGPQPSPGACSVYFRRQFVECGLRLPERALRRTEEILAAAQSGLPRATILYAELPALTSAGDQPRAEPDDHPPMECYQLLSDCICRRGGFILDVMERGITAIFGAPLASDQDIASALLASLDFRDQIELCADRQDGSHAVRIGVATGSLCSSLCEGTAGKVYDLSGEAFGAAQRLQAAAGGNEILICADTQAAVHRLFETLEAAPLARRPSAIPDAAWSVIRRKPQVSLPLRRAFDVPFCGREEELRALMEELLRSPEGHPVSVIHISGEAGIGKSRLVHEALKRAGMDEAAIWWKGAPPASSILLYPVLEWLREEMGLAPGDRTEDVQRRLRHWLAERMPSEETDPLMLEYIFGVSSAVQALQGIPPDRVQRNLFGILRRLILGISAHEPRAAQAPVVLVADDAHWHDPLTVRFLQMLCDWPTLSDGSSPKSQVQNSVPNSSAYLSSPPGSSVPSPDSQSVIPDPSSEAKPPRFILFVIHRSEEAAPFKPAPDHLSLLLTPLCDADRHRLLDRIVPTEELLPEIRSLVLGRAAGNPLFLKEIGQLVREVMRNNQRLNGEALKNHIIEVIPASLRDLIQARIDRLDARLKQALQCASLLGLEFTFPLLDMFDLIGDGLKAHLRALCDMRYLEELRANGAAPNDGRFCFTHGLFRDAAYATLLEDQKRSLHLHLARRLESAFADRIQEHYELLAFHFSKAGETQKAIHYLVKAADRQMGIGGTASAIQNYKEAIFLLQEMPPTPARETLLGRILTRGARLYRITGDPAQAEEMLAGAMECAERLGNEWLLLEARLESAVMRLWQGQGSPAREQLGAVAVAAASLGAARAELTVLNAMGVIHWQQGEFDAALKAFQDLARKAERANAPHAQADAFNNAGLIYWKWGQLTQAIKAFKRALPLRRQAGDGYGLAATLQNLGIVQEQLGQAGPARRSYCSALRLAEQTGHIQTLACVEVNLSNLERRMGMIAAACEHAARAVDHAQAAQDPATKAIAEENWGLACMELGDPQEARAHFSRALALAIAGKQREEELGLHLHLLRLDCEALSLRGNGGSGTSASGAETRFEVRENGVDPSQYRTAESNEASGEPRPLILDSINHLMAQIEENNYADLKPRAWRLKALALETLEIENCLTTREYLKMACDFAVERGHFFEELESRKALRDYHDRHGEAHEAALHAEIIARMEAALGNHEAEN
ncbi:MAG: tetratricopeptide repeat protein [Candidatus Sumerlaeota bacterium]|nr:tetratricopeptide repeat protein [Candidatus Sumerlaeota bacterium]